MPSKVNSYKGYSPPKCTCNGHVTKKKKTHSNQDYANLEWNSTCYERDVTHHVPCTKSSPIPSNPSPNRLPHTMPQPMCDKTLFWMTSNDHFQNKISIVCKPKSFWMINHNDHFILNVHFMFKILRLCMGSIFLVSHHGLRKPRHFYGLPPFGTMSNHNWRAFHLREDLSLLIDTRHIFSLPF